jgi:ribosome maturation factor RimP
MAKITDKIEVLIQPEIQDMSDELVGVEYISSGKHSILRVYIDSDQGIGLNDCETVLRQLSSIFDVLLLASLTLPIAPLNFLCPLTDLSNLNLTSCPKKR